MRREDSLKDSQTNSKKKLTPLQFHVTQQCGTEPPFQNEFWNNKRPGIYVDVLSGEPLFSSKDKFDSGTGWPSFTKPLKEDRIIENVDTSYNMRRVEVRSKDADSHLGHVFDDAALAHPPSGDEEPRGHHGVAGCRDPLGIDALEAVDEHHGRPLGN